MKSETQLDHVKETGGMFGHGIAGLDSASSGGAVPNDCPGSSKTVAQGLRHVTGRLEMPVALGTDWNALLPGPGPRFGPRAAGGIDGEMAEGDAAWQQAVRDERQSDALAQANGVLYDTTISDCRTYRFPAADIYGGTPIEGEDRYLWQAKAFVASGVDLTTVDEAELLEHGQTEAPGLQLAKGMTGVLGSATSDFFIAGTIILTPAIAAPNAHVAALVAAMADVLRLWGEMTTGTSPSLVRSTAGPNREFDYNIDGLSHYGMLPDMLQDLRNVGLESWVFDQFFRSAERYVEVWERSVRVASGIPHP
jgi:hypothetical protein